MTHFPTIDATLNGLYARPGRDGTIRTTAECGRFVANQWENKIRGIAHSTGVELEMTRRKSFFDVTFYLTMSGPTEKLARFLESVQELAS
jgi:hypothetical protein